MSAEDATTWLVDEIAREERTGDQFDRLKHLRRIMQGFLAAESAFDEANKMGNLLASAENERDYWQQEHDAVREKLEEVDRDYRQLQHDYDTVKERATAKGVWTD